MGSGVNWERPTVILKITPLLFPFKVYQFKSDIKIRNNQVKKTLQKVTLFTNNDFLKDKVCLYRSQTKFRNSFLCCFFLQCKFFIFTIAHIMPSAEFIPPTGWVSASGSKASLVQESPACHRLLLVLLVNSQGVL